ncbi:MAG: DEAD/DEAH box helicase [Candidatus Methanofastidiosia archaeon]|jgi:ATP-dependent Lhr-like helicase
MAMISENIQKLIKERGFEKLTLPQKKGIPLIFQGKNVLIIARTGSGKTEAAVFPIFDNLISLKHIKGIKALYIAPLRALNRDLLERMEWWAEELDIKIEVRHGDTSQSQRRKQALSPPDMLITTPETLQAILPGKLMKTHLSEVRYVVMDEIHELVEDKRGTQLSIGLERLTQVTHRKFQRIGLSATVGSPKEVAHYLGGNVTIVDATEDKDLLVQVEHPLEEDIELASQLEVNIETASRIKRIQELLLDHNSVLVFVNTREMAEVLSSRFNILTENIDVHHSSLSKGMRIDTEKKFKSQELKSIICTSSMELGIDVGSVDLVIQYMSPRQVSRLIQRAGRSGHRLGEVSKAVILASNPDDILEAAVIAKNALEHNLEELHSYDLALDVLAHQAVGLAMDNYKLEIDEAFSIIRKAYPYRNLSREQFVEVIHFLKELHLIWVDEEIYGRKRSSFKYYFENLSMIPDTKQYRTLEVGSLNLIGVLDEEFIATKAEIGSSFIMKGRAWNISDIKDGKVLVTETDSLGAIPAWDGELIPVPYDVALETATMREKIEEYPVDQNALEVAQAYIEEQGQYFLPSPDTLVAEVFSHFVVIHAPYGSLVNETIGRLVASLVSAKIGASVFVRSDPYRICFQFPSGPDYKSIIEIIKTTDPQHIQPLLEITLKRSSLFGWKLAQVAKRFGAVSKNAERYMLKRLIYAYEDTPLYEETIHEIVREKLDIPRTQEILEKIQCNEISLVVHKSADDPSPMGLQAVSNMGASDIVFPKRAEREILKKLKKRLESKRVKLFCVHCGKWSATFTIKHLDEYPKCRICGARFLAILYRRDKDTIKAIRKRLKKQKVTKEEEEIIIRAKRSADLMLAYGKKAAIALAGRGLGPQTASRVLAKMHTEEEDLLRDILEAERTYARTRRFWD